MTRLILKQGQNQQFGTTFFPLMLHSGGHICRSHISIRTGTTRNFTGASFLWRIETLLKYRGWRKKRPPAMPRSELLHRLWVSEEVFEPLQHTRNSRAENGPD